MRQMKFTVSKAGDVKLSTEGYAGEACKAASAAYEKALGLKTSDTPTPEAFRADESAEAQAEGRG